MSKHARRLVLALTATVALVVAGANSALAMVFEGPADGGSGHRLPSAPTTVADTGMSVPWLYVGSAIAAAVIVAVGLFLAVRARHSGPTTVQGA